MMISKTPPHKPNTSHRIISSFSTSRLFLIHTLLSNQHTMCIPYEPPLCPIYCSNVFTELTSKSNLCTTYVTLVPPSSINQNPSSFYTSTSLFFLTSIARNYIFQKCLDHGVPIFQVSFFSSNSCLLCL